MPFISSAKNAYFMSGEAKNEIFFLLNEINVIFIPKHLILFSLYKFKYHFGTI